MRSLEELLDQYLRNRPLFLSLIRAKEAWLFQKYLSLKKPALDLGCGDGFFAKMAFGHLDIGLDVPDSRINEVQNTYDRVIAYDGHRIPLKSSSVSTVVSNCVLEHIPNLDEVISEAYRTLKPDGRFLVTVMAKPWEENLVGNLFLGNSYVNWMRRKQVHFNLLSASEWKKKFFKFKVISNTGYLTPRACRLLDVCHYLSLPSLLTYILFRKWNLLGINPYPTSWLARIIRNNCPVEQAGAIFFVLQK